jgi:hypothetical protein
MSSTRKLRTYFSSGSHIVRTFVMPAAAVTLVAFISACGKSGQQTASAPAPAPAPATPAAPAPNPPAPAASSADAAAKADAVNWAMQQDQIKNDPNGQWAISATASSSYNDAKGQDGWSPNQATGAPNVQAYADDGKAWTPKEQTAGIEWLDLKYPRPVHATEVRIRESFNSGSIVKVELFDAANTAHTVWAGNDPTTGFNYLLAKFPKTDYKTDHVKITLATNVGPGWKEIDAVQLVGTDQ